jgi:hypothetical protein
VFEGLAFQIFQRDKASAILFVNFVDRADVRVIQSRGSASLPARGAVEVLRKSFCIALVNCGSLLSQLFVEVDGLLGNCGPAEDLCRAPSSCIPEASAFP